MELTKYAQSLLDSVSNDRGVRTWAYEAQRMVAWHALCLVPFQSDLHGDQRREYYDLLSDVLSMIDPREPIEVPVVVRETLLRSCEEPLLQLVVDRTAVHTAA
ncbi:MAG TPA: hypothetical protein VJ851_08100 [Jatrophihabitans sp.]|nr:hypothetical protein [Jatrophihabitans sp.]